MADGPEYGDGEGGVEEEEGDDGDGGEEGHGGVC